jgi:hypothetical protein
VDEVATSEHLPERPIFVVGLPRSGTTLIEQVLASHSQVFGAGELRLARASFAALANDGSEARAFESLSRLDAAQVQYLAAATCTTWPCRAG